MNGTNPEPGIGQGAAPTRTLITGASAGIGLELARLFAAAGQPLVLVARRADRLAELAAVLRRDFEIAVHVLPSDLARPAAADELVAELQREGLGIRTLVNNAGIGAYGRFTGRAADDYERLLQLNVMTLTRLTRLLLPPMLAAPRGAGPGPGILNVASTAAFQPGPGMAVYFASKAFVLHFSEALHEELRGTGVTATAFCPGATRSEFFGTGLMVPQGAHGPDGDLKPAARAEAARRDARRMDTAVAARAGFEGFRRGRAVVIPGRTNRLLTLLVRLLPRALVRRVTGRALRSDFM